MSEGMRHYAVDILRGERVRLRPLREDDVHSLESWWNDPRWMVFQNAKVVPAPSSSTIEMFRTWSDNKDASSYGFSVEEIESKRLVGHVTL